MSRFTLRLTSGIRLKDKVRFIKLPDLFHDNFVLSWFSVTKLAGDKMISAMIWEKYSSVSQICFTNDYACYCSDLVYLFLWNSFATVNLVEGLYKLDSISIPYPNAETPWNLIFAIKMTPHFSFPLMDSM
jgi:hypothetical protein